MRLVDLGAGQARLFQCGIGVRDVLANRRRDGTGERRMERRITFCGKGCFDRLPVTGAGGLVELDQALGGWEAENPAFMVGGQHLLDQRPVNRVKIEKKQRVEVGIGYGVPRCFRLHMGAGRLDRPRQDDTGQQDLPQTNPQICEQLFT